MKKRMGIVPLTLVMGSTCLLAQSMTTGAISGRVERVEGQPLAGARVVAVSGQIVRSNSTDAAGRFRLAMLAPGNWRLSVTAPGFSSQTQTVRVSMNQTLTCPFRMATEAVATVGVVATSTLIDSTSTSTGLIFDLERMNALPRGREITELARLAPSVSDSGFSGTGGMELSIAGASGAESSYGIDGLRTNDPRYGGRGVGLASDFVDQVDVQTGGFKPEHSALGGIINVVTKSGGNEFAGSAWGALAPTGLRPAPKTGFAAKEGAAPTSHDLGIWVGGALLKDRLFYSMGVKEEGSSLGRGTNNGDSPIGGTRLSTTQRFAKFQYFPHPDHQLTLSHFGATGTKRQRSPGTHLEFADGLGDAVTGATYSDNTSNFSFIYDAVLTPVLTASLKAGISRIANNTEPESSEPRVGDRLFLQGPTVLDSEYSRGGFGPVENQTSRTRQASLDVQWAAGSHVLKGGLSHLDSSYSLTAFATGGAYYTIDLGDTGLPRLRERVVHNDSEVKALYQAIYLQDAWELGSSFHAFFGFRAERQVHRDAYGHRFLDFAFEEHLQPRLGFTWDVLGGGRSKLFASYAVYYEQIPQRMAMGDFSKLTLMDYYYEASAGADVFTYDPAHPNHFGTKADRSDPRVHSIDFASYFLNPPLADNLELPRRLEYQLGYEQSLTSHLKVGLRYQYRTLENALEDSVITDAGGNILDPQGLALIWNPRPGPIAWTAQDGTRVTGESLFPEATNIYRAWVLSLDYRSTRSTLGMHYTWSRLEGNYEGLVSSSNKQSEPNITASWDYFTYVGRGDLPLDRRHQFKAFGTHMLLFGNRTLTLGGRFLWQSGTPISLFDDGSTTLGLPPGTDPSLDLGWYGNAVPAQFRLGQFGRTPSQARLDLSAEFEFQLGKRVRLAPLVEVFNAFNARPATEVLQQATDDSGSPQPSGTWGSPSAWQPGRTWRFGVRAKF